ncbi:MAG: hypothetical protein A2Y62_03965 [Candidatus Fischerbacteria bacterium RBG_13_37_8]|uniref:Uncharacterized protein n=1 Tax=Candidatus Fischerbacteria bacterium RBG_13_37_8 TaxID=1817863 RepID=A0A1F5V5F6_9BACT|nr:MAG: hypothetical protein A2Y62_03965 [Candidatus Fischerbacteria bacterium RBG_13_37_8]
MTTIAKIDKNSGNLQIEIIIGYAQQGRYKIRLWDKDRRNPKVVGEGVNWDEIADTFDLGPANKLINKTLSWDVIVTALQSKSGQFYCVTVILKQKGKPVEGGIFQESGPLEGSKGIFGLRTLV